MLSKPNVSEIMPKVGNRYQSALALAKRARTIENRRVIEGSRDIRDAVDIASNEIASSKAKVKINGEYIVKDDNKDNEEYINSIVKE